MSHKDFNASFINRKKELEEIIRCKNDSSKYQEKLTKLEESILSIVVSKTYNIRLSWGGPSEGFKLDTDDNDNLMGVRYWKAEFLDYDEVRLNEKEQKNFVSVYGYIMDSLEIKY